MRYSVEVSASNKIIKEFETINQVRDFLKNCRGLVSVLDNTRPIGWQEIAFGKADQIWRNLHD